MRVAGTLKNLLVILKRLYDGKELSVKELSNELGVSERAVSRYFNEYLKDAGFPLKKKGRRFVLESSNENILTAIEAIENFAKEAGFYNQIKKYIKQIKVNSINPIFTKLHIEDISERLNDFETIEKAIRENRIIEFVYDGYKRKTKPLKLANFEGYWYLMGLDINENDKYKTFHFKSIEKVKLSNETFEEVDLKLENAINVWFEPFKKPFRVEFIADKWVSRYLQRIPLNPTQKIIQKYNDGSVLFEIKVTHFEEIKPIVKRYLPQIRVLSPKELDDEIKEEIKEYLNLIHNS